MNKTYALIGIAVLIAGSLIVLFATRDMHEGSRSDLRVAASFYPIYYLATQIAGDKAEVFNVTPAGAEPHDFEPSASDWVQMAESAVLFVNGGDIDVWSKDASSQLSSNTMVVTVAGSLMTLESEEHHHGEEEGEHHEEGEHEEGEHEEGEEHELDPHVWLSPRLMLSMAAVVRDGLIKADPSNADYYTSQAQILATKLSDLDTEFSSQLSQCKRKEFVTSHAAFGYLAQSYGLTQVPIAGISPEEEPSAQDIANVVKLIREKNITTVFSEPLVSPKFAETIAKETGARTVSLNPLEGLLKEDIAAGKDYVIEMRQNLENLKLALDCAR